MLGGRLASRTVRENDTDFTIRPDNQTRNRNEQIARTAGGLNDQQRLAALFTSHFLRLLGASRFRPFEQQDESG